MAIYIIMVDKSIFDAREQVKELLRNKGVDVNSATMEMVDMISSKLSSANLSENNLYSKCFDIAQNVVEEMKPKTDEILKDCNIINQVFQEYICNDNENTSSTPSKLSNQSVNDNVDNYNYLVKFSLNGITRMLHISCQMQLSVKITDV